MRKPAPIRPSIPDLVEHIKRKRIWIPPHPQTDRLLRQVSSAAGHPLPADLLEFYNLCGGAELAKDDDTEIMGPDALGPVAALQLGADNADYFPAHWIAFLDLHSGDYVAIDLALSDPRGAILDCDHNDAGPLHIIATDFTQFLHQLLTNADSHFWIHPLYKRLGQIHSEPPPSFYKRENADWYAALPPEVGPLKCIKPGCDHLQLRVTAHCRRHHYEATMKHACPFDED